MKKLFFLIILLPFLAALGHDIYFYQQDPSKGFHLSDTGALWDKYHKESHDQWKNKVQEIGETVSEISPIDFNDMTNTSEEKKVDPKLPYAESFTQVDQNGKDTRTTPLKKKDVMEENVVGVQKLIGFILEQKAVFVFGAFALVIFLLSAIISFLTREKSSMDKVKAYKKKGKDGGYKYSKK